MNREKALQAVTDYVVGKNLEDDPGNAAARGNVLAGALMGGAFGSGLSSSGVKGLNYHANLSPLHYAELRAFLDSEGVVGVDGYIQQRARLVGTGKNAVAKWWIRGGVTLVVIGVFPVVFSLMSVFAGNNGGQFSGSAAVAILIGLCLVALGVLVSLRVFDPRKRAMDAIWGKKRGPEESIAALLPKLLATLQ